MYIQRLAASADILLRLRLRRIISDRLGQTVVIGYIYSWNRPMHKSVQHNNTTQPAAEASVKKAATETAFTDNRPVAVAQRRMQAMMNSSERVTRTGDLTKVIQGRFRGDPDKHCYIDEDTNEEYDVLGQWETYRLMQRRTDGFQVRVSIANNEPIENEQQRAFRLNNTSSVIGPTLASGKASSSLSAENYPPTVADLYQKMFPGGSAFKHASLQEALKTRMSEIIQLKELAKEVEELKNKARAGDQEARNALQEKGQLLTTEGQKLSKELFGQATDYHEFLSLMDMFLAGTLVANPVYTGLLWEESSALQGQLRAITQYGVTTWESQPSGPVEKIMDNKVQVYQYAFLEMSGPAETMGPLVKLLAPVSTIRIVFPGQTTPVPLKQFRAASAARLQALVSPRTDAEPRRKGKYFCLDWYAPVANDSKYIHRAVAASPSLGAIIGEHVYIHLISKDADSGESLFDVVTAMLGKVGQPQAKAPASMEDDGGEADAEREHQASYSGTAQAGLLSDS